MQSRNNGLGFLIICDCVSQWVFRFLHPVKRSVLQDGLWNIALESFFALYSQPPLFLADAVVRRFPLFKDLSFVYLSELLGDCINIWFIHCSLRKMSMFQPSSLTLQSSSSPRVLHFGSCLYYDSMLSLAREGHDTSPKAIV